MKKILIIIALSMFMLMTGCSKQSTKTKKDVVVTTSFLADMVSVIAGQDVNVHTIIPAGEDPHLYTAKTKDLEVINKADLLLYHGLHFEGKMEDVLEKKGKAVTKDFKKEEIGRMEEDGHTIIDPHFWFDINLYKKAVSKATDYLSKLNEDKKETYYKNRDAYLKKLDDLHAENKKKLEKIPAARRYLVTPHDAFNYFSRLYNIQVVAPQGVSTDSEVANKDIETTANFILKHKIKAIFSESTTNPERMKKLQEVVKAKGFSVKVVSGEGQELFSDSLAQKGKDGDTYIEMYRHNINLIYENLK
ncbi:hypothetical protein HMPREF9943_00824 [Eggerthia catenaformis OT 569 = DSM 20559]|uniref:Uncharacterized protein n=1 Tax=Eggerthia catenaformis OT 569 = DSM 20559 TaxID=999415 RepID=M2P8V1_9FIRM|nr:zinc ABC transporter substrate-binding protein [Eggerthia catenaformis]EMD16782.1 hypothetical protein HMPREF9943_00824 [Eggerthia catenaformis OT 569 = DSM 20559]